MGVNLSYWLIYGVDVHTEYKAHPSDEQNRLGDVFDENQMIASYWSKLDGIKNKNTILIGEDHTIFGRVFNFCREEDGLYSIMTYNTSDENHVLPVSDIAKELGKKINEDIFNSVRRDLKIYFDIDDKIPQLLIINHFS